MDGGGKKLSSVEKIFIDIIRLLTFRIGKQKEKRKDVFRNNL
jgi:hypothetical protein